MLIVPGKRFRNKRSGKICTSTKVTKSEVGVMYRGSKVVRWYALRAFGEGFESVP